MEEGQILLERAGGCNTCTCQAGVELVLNHCHILAQVLPAK